MAKRRSYKRDRLGRFAGSAAGRRKKGLSKRNRYIRNAVGAAAIATGALRVARDVSAERTRRSNDLWADARRKW